jgi:hypothetical protein
VACVVCGEGESILCRGGEVLTFGLWDRWTVKRGRRSGARVRLVARTGKEYGSHM